MFGGIWCLILGGGALAIASFANDDSVKWWWLRWTSPTISRRGWLVWGLILLGAGIYMIVDAVV